MSGIASCPSRDCRGAVRVVEHDRKAAVLDDPESRDVVDTRCTVCRMLLGREVARV